MKFAHWVIINIRNITMNVSGGKSIKHLIAGRLIFNPTVVAYKDGEVTL